MGSTFPEVFWTVALIAKRASAREVLGLSLPVASIEDVLQGKIWAASDPDRRRTKRRKDLLDVARILEAREIA